MVKFGGECGVQGGLLQRRTANILVSCVLIRPSFNPQTFRLTEELKQCDQAYRNGILALEDSRFKLQDVVEKGFRELERLESERVEVSRDACARYAKTNELLVAKSSEVGISINEYSVQR